MLALFNTIHLYINHFDVQQHTNLTPSFCKILIIISTTLSLTKIFTQLFPELVCILTIPPPTNTTTKLWQTLICILQATHFHNDSINPGEHSSVYWQPLINIITQSTLANTHLYIDNLAKLAEVIIQMRDIVQSTRHLPHFQGAVLAERRQRWPWSETTKVESFLVRRRGTGQRRRGRYRGAYWRRNLVSHPEKYTIKIFLFVKTW